MDNLATIRRLHQHRAWSSRNLRNAARNLSDAQLDQPFEIGLGNLRKTLTHMHGAETVWLMALNGNADTPSAFGFHYDSFDALDAAWEKSERDWSAFLSVLTQADLTRPIVKTMSLTGERYTTPMHDILLHVCMHAHHHTAQAINMMRHVGVPADKLPASMLITLSRQEQA